MQERPVGTCVLFSCLCCFSSTGTDSSELLTYLCCGYCNYRMNCSAILDFSKITLFCFCFLFVLCHSQDISTALLCRAIEKGISDCSTLTKLSVDGYENNLPPQYSSASMRAAMAPQSSLTEVEWSRCSFECKSTIGVTVLVCCECGICMGVG